MSRPNRIAARTILLAVLVTVAGTALADHYTDDARSGKDAGNVQSDALAIPYGSHPGWLGPRDWDWFRVEETVSAPRCVKLAAAGDNNLTARLSVVSPDGTRTASARIPGGSAKSLAIAAPALTRSFADLTASPNHPESGDPARPGHYSFHIASVGVPAPSAGDALTGRDAGGSLDKAAPIPGACIGGNIAPLSQMGDLRDYYSFELAAATDVAYGFAAQGDPGALTLTLLDANGVPLGAPLVSGGQASLALPAGKYYLATGATTVPAMDLGYVISVIGPPDPGSSCRPNC